MNYTYLLQHIYEDHNVVLCVDTHVIPTFMIYYNMADY